MKADSFMWADYPLQNYTIFFLLAGSRNPSMQPFPVMPNENLDILGGFETVVPSSYMASEVKNFDGVAPKSAVIASVWTYFRKAKTLRLHD